MGRSAKTAVAAGPVVTALAEEIPEGPEYLKGRLARLAATRGETPARTLAWIAEQYLPLAERETLTALAPLESEAARRAAQEAFAARLRSLRDGRTLGEVEERIRARVAAAGEGHIVHKTTIGVMFSGKVAPTLETAREVVLVLGGDWEAEFLPLLRRARVGRFRETRSLPAKRSSGPGRTRRKEG
jgi:hypothetical protein